MGLSVPADKQEIYPKGIGLVFAAFCKFINREQ